MATNSQDSLLKRIKVSSGVNVDDLECIICHDLLWKPITCGNCDGLYCTNCIMSWLAQNPENCPNCRNYAERRCTPFVVRQLARLQIACINQSNGCPQIVGYEALEKHELECDYKLQQCFSCKMAVLEKDLAKHQDNCGLIELTCSECNVMYARNNATLHTENRCLREQLRQFRQDFNVYKQQQSSTVESLRQELTKYKQQETEMIDRRIVVKSRQHKNDINKHETKIQELSQQLNLLSIKLIKFAVPGTYQKLGCEGRPCIVCGKCRDWYFNGDRETWKWIQNVANWSKDDWQRWNNDRVWERFQSRHGSTCGFHHDDQYDDDDSDDNDDDDDPHHFFDHHFDHHDDFVFTDTVCLCEDNCVN